MIGGLVGCSNLCSVTFVFALLALAASGARGSALGFLVGSLVVVWSAPRFRLPVAAALAAVALVASGALLATGRFTEIVESRLSLAGFSWDLRLQSWESGLDGLRQSVLFGVGVVPNTIDGTLFYYLGVGGLVGLALVVALYWTTLLRPFRRGDWAGLPILVAAAPIGILQEVLGTPRAGRSGRRSSSSSRRRERRRSWALGRTARSSRRPGAGRSSRSSASSPSRAPPPGRCSRAASPPQSGRRSRRWRCRSGWRREPPSSGRPTALPSRSSKP